MALQNINRELLIALFYIQNWSLRIRAEWFLQWLKLYLPCLMIRYGITENLLDMMTKYEYWENVDLLKCAEILPEQIFGYHDRKPNISR